MIETIVVPLDGSPLAEEALPTARAIAGRTGKPLRLVRVIAPSALAAARDEAEDYLRATAEQLGGAETTVWLGDPAEQIVEGLSKLPGAMAVMTTHGRTGIGRWIFGSVADRVVHAGVAPVLLIRSGNPAPTVLRQIMVPLDGSALSETALPLAEQLAHDFNATLELVRVVETSAMYGMFGSDYGAIAAAPEALQQLIEEVVADANGYLDGVAARLKERGLTAGTAVLEGLIADQLLAFGRRQRIDLIVMATRGRAGVSRLVLGSVAEQMLRLGDRPLLLAPPRQPEPAG
ncbi:MAG TPA: universal stress protein [Thermomicrobiaceae bacterium]|nr:universal stress protein [Thermomicrobiaceae bacterium]